MGQNRNLHKLSLLSCTLFVIISCFSDNFTYVNGQRSLLHWKRDLEFRLASYSERKNTINNILESSIYQAEQSLNESRGRNIFSVSNVRFTDLILQNGSIILDRQIARQTADILVDKTLNYLSSKMNELNHMRNQLSVIGRQLQNPPIQYVYKGNPSLFNYTSRNVFQSIKGTRIFKQLNYARYIESQNLNLRFVNYSNVDKVLKETYMENPDLGQLDSKSRLFFEGRKTFYNSVFIKQLKSGCCDRLKPLHTSRMMTRSTNQNVVAPVLLQLDREFPIENIFIRNLKTNQLVNQILAPTSNYGSFVPSQIENVIQLSNIIDLRLPNRQNILKTLVFQGIVNIDKAYLDTPDSRFVIGFASHPQLYLDLSHRNHLLRYLMSPNKTSTPTQRIYGQVIINSANTHFGNGLDAATINNVPDFNRFVVTNIVRIDKPATIRGLVRFDALPITYINPNIRMSPPRPPSVLSMRINGSLFVNLVNGMRIPHDIILLPVNPNELIRIAGPRQFTSTVQFDNSVRVRQLVNGMRIPEGVIPLHYNDFDPAGITKIIFRDGIKTDQVNLIHGQFDDIPLRNVNNAVLSAPNLIFNTVFSLQPDGITHLVRAPLRINNLVLIGNGPNQGLLNGFRPQDVIGLARPPIDTFYGRKTFLAPIEATECIFNEINNISNWTNHLIRIDRPNTIQTVHTKLEFLQPLPNNNNINNPGSSVAINSLIADFYPNNNPTNYLNNIKLSPELFILYQALSRGLGNTTRGRMRIINHVNVMNPRGGPGLINNVALEDIVKLNEPFTFADRFTLVGKVHVMGNLRAGRITSNYPIDVMDLEQFNKYRIPIINSRLPIKLNNLVLASDNQASMVRCRMLNGIQFSEFANSIMSLTRPQVIDRGMTFVSPVNFEGLLRTESSLNGIQNFKQFTNTLKNARYSFEDGLQCNTVIMNNN